MPRYSAFVSYSRKDTKLISPFKDALDNAKLNYWIDEHKISGGDLWETEIRRALTQSNCLIVFVSQNTADGYVPKEIEIARDLRKPIIPVALDASINSDHPSISFLRQYQFIDARDSLLNKAVEELPDTIKKKDSAPVIAVYNVKGGVGKTTVTMNLGMYYYKQKNKRVLLIDMDAQTNLSTALILPKIEIEGAGLFGLGGTKKVTNVLEALQNISKSSQKLLQDSYTFSGDVDKDFKLSDYIHTIESAQNSSTLDIVAADPKLHKFATSDSQNTSAAQKGFSRFIGQCRTEYDCIIIDMGPSVNHLSLCALSVSTHVLSPVSNGYFAMQGLDLLDNISPEDDVTSTGREHLVLINSHTVKDAEIVRSQMTESNYNKGLLRSELAFSKYFANSVKKETINPTLSFLTAYNKWGASPRTERKSLQNVATEIADRVGLQL